jgi:hypothetical protein
VLQGRGLKKKVGSGTRNAYVEVSLGNRVYQTPVAWRTLSPSWEAAFVLYVVVESEWCCWRVCEYATDKSPTAAIFCCSCWASIALCGLVSIVAIKSNCKIDVVNGCGCVGQERCRQ